METNGSKGKETCLHRFGASHKIIAVSLAVLMLFAFAIVLTDSSDDVDAATYQGNCGIGVKWTCDGSTLKIYSAGGIEMYDYTTSSQPWKGLNFQYLVVDYGISYIGENAFHNCSSLRYVDLPYTVHEIGEGAFAECTSLTMVDIPSGVGEIKEATFLGCIRLSSVSLPWTLIAIDIDAFNNCSSLEYIDLPSNLNYIGYGAFSYCPLTTIYIPYGVNSINPWAFEGTTFYDSDGVNELSENEIPGFWYKGTNGKLIRQDGREAIGGTCGDGLTWSLEGGKLTIDKSSEGTGEMSNFDPVDPAPWRDYSVVVIVISDGVTTIGDYAFDSFDAIEYLSVPMSVTSVGWESFGDISFYVREVEAEATADTISGRDWVSAGDGDLYSQQAKVTFIENGSIMPYTLVTDYFGIIQDFPDDPKYMGSVFVGWFIDADPEMEVDSSTQFFCDCTLVALWEDDTGSYPWYYPLILVVIVVLAMLALLHVMNRMR